MEFFTNKVFAGDSMRLLRRIPDESVDCVITDSMFGYGQNTVYNQYDWGSDPNSGSPEKHWAYHKPYHEECLRVLKPGGRLAWCQSYRQSGHFRDWFGNHRVWMVTRLPERRGYASANVWIVQTREREPVRFPDDDAIILFSFHEKLNDLHCCPKPVSELEFLVRHLSEPGQLVLDCFCGLGSTLIAAKKLGRKYCGCDLSENYTAIALKRLALV